MHKLYQMNHDANVEQLSGQRSKNGEDVTQSLTNTITSITGTLGL